MESFVVRPWRRVLLTLAALALAFAFAPGIAEGTGFYAVVDIDVKPGSDPSCFNSDGQGAIPVAILSSVTFDATQVDPASLDMDGQAVRVRGNKLQAHIEDSNNDGLLDLVVQFEDGGVYSPVAVIATVMGQTFGGEIVFGQSDICVVPR